MQLSNAKKFRRSYMAESGASRQRSSEASESSSKSREEQRGSQLQRSSGGIQRRGNFLPSIFSISPRDFFTQSPLGLMRRFADEMDRAVSGFGVPSSGASG